MESHPVPREIASFEFKLIGFMTLHQFYYVLIFGGVGVVFYFIKLPLFVNYFLCGVSVAIGIGLAFGKYNDRPVDNLIKNLIIHLTRPTQFSFHKNNLPPDYLLDVLVVTKGPMLAHHQQASGYLKSYQNSTAPGALPTTAAEPKTKTLPSSATPTNENATNVKETTLVYPTPTAPIASTAPNSTTSAAEPISPQPTPITDKDNAASNTAPTTQAPTKPSLKPYITGVTKTPSGTILSNILVYFKSPHGSIVRLVKTNQNGVFASFHPLPLGDYVIEAKDLSGTKFFDTINITIGDSSNKPIEIFSQS